MGTEIEILEKFNWYKKSRAFSMQVLGIKRVVGYEKLQILILRKLDL